MSDPVRVFLDEPALHGRERGQRLAALEPRRGLLQRQTGAGQHLADQRRHVPAADTGVAVAHAFFLLKSLLIRSHRTDQKSEPAFSGSLSGGGGATVREGPPAAAVAGGGPPWTGPDGASRGPAPALEAAASAS